MLQNQFENFKNLRKRKKNIPNKLQLLLYFFNVLNRTAQGLKSNLCNLYRLLGYIAPGILHKRD